MATVSTKGSLRDRSPSYPVLSLEKAVDLLSKFYAFFKNSAARPDKVGDAWELKGSALISRYTAALRYFGLLEYTGSGKERRVVITSDAKRYLRAQMDETKQELLRIFALQPTQIAKFWKLWGNNRPTKDACKDQLVFDHKFSENGAAQFLKVYDATITYAPMEEDKDEDKEKVDNETSNVEASNSGNGDEVESIAEIFPAKYGVSNQLKRVLVQGILSVETTFQVVVSGPVGPTEINRLIRKLELDREILAESTDQKVLESGGN